MVVVGDGEKAVRPAVVINPVLSIVHSAAAGSSEGRN